MLERANPYPDLTGSFFAARKAVAAAPKANVFKAIAVDDQEGVIVGVGAVAGNVDLDDEVLERKAMIKMAYDFCSKADRKFKVNHENDTDAELVSSWPGAPILKSGRVLGFGEEIPMDDEIVGISLAKGKESHWFVGVRPRSESVLEAAKAGAIAGFSWSGAVSRE